MNAIKLSKSESNLVIYALTILASDLASAHFAEARELVAKLKGMKLKL
jgi:hypothetical protein